MRTNLLALVAAATLVLGSGFGPGGPGAARGAEAYTRWDPVVWDEGRGFLDDPPPPSPFVQGPPSAFQQGTEYASPYEPFRSDGIEAAGYAPPRGATEGPAPSGWAARVAHLARGRVQLEGGYAYLSDRIGGTRTSQHALPDLLLRIGLTERLEARIGWPGYVSTRHHGDFGFETSETLDPNVGFMLDLWPQRGWLPQTAAAASVPITLSGNPFALEGLQPVAQVLYAWGLTDRLTLGGNTGYTLFRHPDDHYSQFQQSLGVDYLLTDRFTALVQWEMLSNHGSVDDGVEHMLGAGCWYALTERWSVGGRLAGGLNTRAPDFLATIRFAVRF